MSFYSSISSLFRGDILRWFMPRTFVILKLINLYQFITNKSHTVGLVDHLKIKINHNNILIRKAVYVQRNIEARSRNHFRSGKVIKFHLFSECVCSLGLQEWKAHAPYYIVICSLSRSTLLFHVIS